jgi:hypothetical protein
LLKKRKKRKKSYNKVEITIMQLIFYNGNSATGGWRYGTCLAVSSGEPIAMHNLPFPRPTTQVLPGKTPYHCRWRGFLR